MKSHSSVRPSVVPTARRISPNDLEDASSVSGSVVRDGAWAGRGTQGVCLRIDAPLLQDPEQFVAHAVALLGLLLVAQLLFQQPEVVPRHGVFGVKFHRRL